MLRLMILRKEEDRLIVYPLFTQLFIYINGYSAMYMHYSRLQSDARSIFFLNFEVSNPFPFFFPLLNHTR